jgi:hypothetical protein
MKQKLIKGLDEDSQMIKSICKILKIIRLINLSLKSQLLRTNIFKC